MVKRGSITVFLALTLGLILSLLSSGLESARMAAARTQILNGMDIGLYSLFGQYNKSFLKDFDLFAVDGACGGKEMNLASIYDNLESYMKPVMKQNSQKLSVQQGGISGYLLMTDSEGEVFYQQAVQYMKETLGSHGAKLLLNKIQNMQKKTIEAERQGNEIESKGTIENYESEMDTAQQKSQALLEEKKKQEQKQSAQIGLFDYVADIPEEQYVDESNQVSLFTDFGVSQQIIDEALCIGANDTDSTLDIAMFFRRDRGTEYNTEFLKNTIKLTAQAFISITNRYQFGITKTALMSQKALLLKSLLLPI